MCRGRKEFRGETHTRSSEIHPWVGPGQPLSAIVFDCLSDLRFAKLFLPTPLAVYPSAIVLHILSVVYQVSISGAHL